MVAKGMNTMKAAKGTRKQTRRQRNPMHFMQRESHRSGLYLVVDEGDDGPRLSFVALSTALWVLDHFPATRRWRSAREAGRCRKKDVIPLARKLAGLPAEDAP